MGYKAIAFDVDGTLYPSTALYLRSVLLALRTARLGMVFGKVRKELRELARGAEYRASPPPDGPAFRRFEAHLVAKRIGWSDERTAAAIQDRLYVRVEALFERVRPYSGAVAALEAFERAGLRLAALSDLPPWGKLKWLGVDRFFEIALCSEDSGFLKPSPEPFRMLANALGLDPAEILFIGNSREYDVTGAKAVGMGTALISYRPRILDAGGVEPDFAFRDWGRLVDFALSRAAAPGRDS